MNCVGCGYCCIKTPCDASRRLFPHATMCPKLEWNESSKRYFCGLALIPTSLGERYCEELAIGAGCCSSMNSWRKDVKRRELHEIHGYGNRPSSQNIFTSEFQIFLACMGRQFISGDLMYLTIISFIAELQEKGMEKHEAEFIGKQALNYIQNNRSKFTEGFMG